MDDRYEFFKEIKKLDLTLSLKQVLINKYYNLWMDKFEWNGLDEDNKDQQKNFIMRKFWSDGTIAARKVNNLDMLVFTPWTRGDINLYDFPTKVQLVNLHNTSTRLIPSTPQVVDKDVVLIWCQPNHKTIKEVVDYYVDRLVQIEMVTNTNLNLHKMPYLIPVTEQSKKKAKDMIDRILNNELVVFTDVKDINSIQAVVTNTPYIIDKLRSVYVSYENELMTYLGLNNSGSQEKKAQLLVDEVNSNNDIINLYGDAIYNEINAGIQRLNKIFNRNITVENKTVVIDAVNDFESNDIEEQKETSSNE